MDAETASTGQGPFSRLVTVESTTSTQTDLRQALTTPTGHLDPASAATWPHLSALRARHQTAGRGRSGRRWVTPPSGALTVSVVLRPCVPVERTGWLPLLAGLAVRDALAPVLAAAQDGGPGWEAGVKWPNDVVVRPRDGATVREVPGWAGWRKVAGILTDLVLPDRAAPTGPPASPAAREADGDGAPDAPDAPGAAVGPDRSHLPAVVVGIGVNVAQASEDLPVDWAASLATIGVDVAPDAVLALVGHHLRALVGQWEAVGGDPDSGDGALGRRLRDACLTLGEQVEARTPAGTVVGRAVDLRPGLVLATADGAREVTAGDVTLRRTPDGQGPRHV